MTNSFASQFHQHIKTLKDYSIPQLKPFNAKQPIFSMAEQTPTVAEREKQRARLANVNTEPSIELLDWINKQLDSGVGRAQIYRNLLEQGYAMELIDKAMYGFKPVIKDAALLNAALRKTGDTSPGMYFAFANIKLTRHPNARRVEDLRAQIFTVEQMLSEAQCAELLAVLKGHFQPSTVVDQEKNGNDGYRTSSTAYLEQVAPEIHTDIKSQICTAVGIDAPYLESLQVQRYEPGEQYKVHTDWFHQSSPTYEECIAGIGQRTWTCLVYLNDDFCGGGTRFTDLDIDIKPKTGMALCWNNLSPLGKPNVLTNHSGLPVAKGAKFIVSAWFREKPIK
jgi:hypothetical protein